MTTVPVQDIRTGDHITGAPCPVQAVITAEPYTLVYIGTDGRQYRIMAAEVTIDPRPTMVEDAADLTVQRIPDTRPHAAVTGAALAYLIGATVTWASWGVGAALWLTLTALAVVGCLAHAEHTADTAERRRAEAAARAATARAYAMGLTRGANL